MISYIIRRCLTAIPTLLVISIVGFVIIQLPEGDFLDRKIAELEQQFGDSSSIIRADELRARYGLGQPVWKRYIKWISGFVRGDFGESFEYEREVNELIWGRLGYTVLIVLGGLAFSYIMAIPLGIYSATHQNKFSDVILTFFSFLGMSLPSFLIALVVIVFAFKVFGVPLFGLFSSRYEAAGWSPAKFADLLRHLWLPVIIVGINTSAKFMRVMRGNLLDILGQPFLQTARAKGVSEKMVVIKHAAKLAINPLVSILGTNLPYLLSVSTIVSIVMGLPTAGPMLYRALISEDVYLAGTLIIMFSILVVAGNLISDVILSWIDPRIRYE